jgi:hypothetical protein
MTSAGWIRDFWRRRRLNQWSARDSYPAQLRRKYASEDEREKDGARLRQHGYRVIDETDSGATIDVAPEQNVYSRDIPSRMTFDMPLAVVFYERDPLSSRHG